MDLSLVKNNKTRIKVSLKELQNNEWLNTILSTMKPYKESSRYKYYLVEGDLLNRKKNKESEE